MATVSKVTPPTAEQKAQYVALAKQAATRFRVPLDVVLGVIAQESRYDATAYRWNEENEKDRSFGLMQLTIPTAQEMADKLYGAGKVNVTSDYLFNPGNNVTLGTFYLRYQFERHGQNWNNAISAYNAGRPISGNIKYVTNVLTKGSALVALQSPFTVGAMVVGGIIAYIIYRRMKGAENA